MNEEDYLLLSDIHNFTICPRRWALSTLENKRVETWRVIDGINMHKRAHDASLTEKRGDTIIMRAVKVSSRLLGLSGECDVVNFFKDDNGVELIDYSGKYIPFPIEYKRGKEPPSECDRLQLCAQAMCLEEMLVCKIPRGALFYGLPHRRAEIFFSEEMRSKVISTANEMHRLMESGHTPKAVKTLFCKECSLNGECLPDMGRKQPVKEYIRKHLENR